SPGRPPCRRAAETGITAGLFGFGPSPQRSVLSWRSAPLVYAINGAHGFTGSDKARTPGDQADFIRQAGYPGPASGDAQQFDGLKHHLVVAIHVLHAGATVVVQAQIGGRYKGRLLFRQPDIEVRGT